MQGTTHEFSVNYTKLVMLSTKANRGKSKIKLIPLGIESGTSWCLI